MNKKTCSVLTAALLLGLASCSDENPWAVEGGEGTISLSLQTDGSVVDAIPQTRGDGSEYFTAPEAKDFYVHLLKGDEVHTNLTHDEFVEPGRTFPTGTYALKAFSGSLEAEGFDVAPYFEGMTQVTVLEGREAKTSVTASLGHTLVSVAYTDEFKSYMKSYSSKLNSEGHSTIDVDAANEGKSAFLVPGDVSVWVNFTDPQGRELSLMPAKFPAEAAHHYQVRFNVNNGQVAFPQLEISFVTELEEETVTIDLTDDLFAAKAPEVQAEGFTPGQDIEFLTGGVAESRYRFNVLSYGGLGSVQLTLNRLEGNGETLPFSGMVNLIGASEAQQATLKAAGFDCKGVFRNPDKLAYIDFTHVPEMLPAGRYELTVVATDLLTRASEPVTVYIDSKDATVSATAISANPATHEGKLMVTYNGGNPEALSFKAANAYYMMEEVKVKSYTLQTRAYEDLDYLFVIELPEFGARTTEDVEVYLGTKRMAKVSLPVKTSFDVDAFATKAVVKVIAAPAVLSSVTDKAQIEVSDENGPVSGLTFEKNTKSGYIVVKGLEPSKDYTFTVSGYDDSETEEGAFHTEAATQLDNWTLDATTQTINIPGVKAGGTFTYTLVLPKTYQHTTTIQRHTPDSWGTVNDVTCDPSSQNLMTWFVVPSTYSEDGKAVIRSVGYNHNGMSPADFSVTRGNYYSQNAPADDQLIHKAGELFYQGTGAFNSRPASVSFEYIYEAKDADKAEKGKAEIHVYSGNVEIGSGSAEIADGDGNATVEVAYKPYLDIFRLGATSIEVRFVSSTASNPYIYKPTGTQLADNYGSWSPGIATNGGTIATNASKAVATGSQLTVDNVKLNY